MIDPEVIAQATQRLRAEFSPVLIYHFGSTSRGAGTVHSDLDLLVVVERSSEDFFDRTQRAFRCLRGVPAPVDVMVYTRAEFDEWTRSPHSFESEVRRNGRLVYAA